MEEKIKVGAVILFWVAVFMWFTQGGSSDEYNAQHTITVDCSDPVMRTHSPVCNGDAAAQAEEENYQTDSYNQQLGH